MSVRQPQFDQAPLPSEPAYTQGGLRPEDILRTLVILAGVLVGGYVLGNWTFNEVQGRGTPYFVMAVCVGVIVTALAYWKFELVLIGFIGLIWINIGGTPDVATGVSSGAGKNIYPVELATIFLAFIWFLRDVTKGRFHWARTPMNKPLVVYFVFCVLSALTGWMFFSDEVKHSVGQQTSPVVYAVELMLRLLSFAAFWLIASNLNDKKWLRMASWCLLVPGILILLARFHVFPSLQASNWGILMECILACTLLAWLLEGREAALFAGQPDRGRRLRPLGWLLLAVIITQAFFFNINWISGWVCLFIGLLFVLFLRSKKLFVLVVCLAIILALASQPFIQAKIVHKVQTSGDSDRFLMARGAFLYAIHFPMGIGPGNYRLYNMYYGSPLKWGTTTYSSAHDFYAQTLSETGFVGLLLTVAWVVAGLIMLARFYHRLPPGFSRIVTLGIAGMWAGVAAASDIGDYFIPVYHNGGIVTMSLTIYFWLALGVATAHARLNGILLDSGQLPPPERPSKPTRISPVDYYPRRMSR